MDALPGESSSTHKSSVPAAPGVTRNGAAASLFLSVALIVIGLALYFAQQYRQDRYAPGVGARYPYWYGATVDDVEEQRETESDWCKSNASDDLYCKLLAKHGTPQQSSNERVLIEQATASRRDSDYCDSFIGDCAPQPTNITLSDASDIFSYLDIAYLQPAIDDIERGRVASAATLLRRMEYLLGRIDLPLGTARCCSGLDAMYLAPAFLPAKGTFSDRRYVLEVLNLSYESGGSSAYPAIAIYGRGIDASQSGCHSSAARIFAQLGYSDGGKKLRELGSYLALVSDFRAGLKAESTCESSEPPPLSDADWQGLKANIERRSFKTDIAQMEAAKAKSEPHDAS